MIERIVFITNYPFNKRDYDRFGIETLLNNGFELEIWDITAILHKNLKNCHEKINDLNFKKIRIFEEKKDIIQSISSLDEQCIVNCLIEYSTRSFFIFRALSKKKIKYCVLQMISFPNPLFQKKKALSSTRHLFKRIISMNFTDIMRYFFDKILLRYYFLFGIKAADIVLFSGEKSFESKIFPTDKYTKFLWVHALDYDLYLQLKDKRGTSETGTGIFLDEYFPFHPDFKFLGIESPVSPEEYYPKLCRFFDYLERELHTRIIIAAHPRSDYNASSDYFQGRTVIKGDTARLVRDSSFVITHMSTSLNFAILFNKPILFVTMDKIQKLDSGKYIPGLYINTVSSELMSEPINIDHLTELNSEIILQIDNRAYKAYKINYIKKEGTPELPFWEIFSLYITGGKFQNLI